MHAWFDSTRSFASRCLWTSSDEDGYRGTTWLRRPVSDWLFLQGVAGGSQLE